MDQPISCDYVHFIYKHPLSILIHLKYQDKDGCSKNGSREFLFELTLHPGRPLSYNNTVWHNKYDLYSLLGVQFDHRDVPFYISSSIEKVNKDFLEFSSCMFGQNPNSTHSVDSDTFMVLGYVLYILRCVFNGYDDSIMKGRKYIRSHVLSTIGSFMIYFLRSIYHFPTLIFHQIKRCYYSSSFISSPNKELIICGGTKKASSSLFLPDLYHLNVDRGVIVFELLMIHCLEDVKWLTNLRSLEVSYYSTNLTYTHICLENSFDF